MYGTCTGLYVPPAPGWVECAGGRCRLCVWCGAGSADKLGWWEDGSGLGTTNGGNSYSAGKLALLRHRAELAPRVWKVHQT